MRPVTRAATLGLIALFHSFTAAAVPYQATETKSEASPEQVIMALFDAMRAGDSKTLLSLWVPQATDAPSLRRITADGQLHPDGLSNWATSVSGFQVGDLDEQIFNAKTQQFGRLATVWAPFKINVKGKLAGCGVNMFTLIKKKGQGWKILNGIDTNHAGDCETYGKPPK